MNKGKVIIYTGEGHGKSSAGLGCAVQKAAKGEHVVIIQFLKGKGVCETEFIKNLEPEIRIFRFEKSDRDFNMLSSEQQEEELMNIRNGFGYARKIMSTGECNLLVLDEVLGLVDTQIISAEDLAALIENKPEEMDLILTGITAHDEICKMADEVNRIEPVTYE
ncbi:MAG: cob(I)yrinic acid a,c-diamide adenosyltransferase [Lachnospiraceae bacterium]|nr:cob(I)yrinic acid a,c-diamide adenosyltransferase [Lachnospiraceae bacterium]